jgi:ankyrin repeat protein
MSDVAFLGAAVRGDLATLASLLDSGYDPDLTHPRSGATALYNACFANQAEAVRMLLARGADPNKRITFRSSVDGRIEKDVVALMLASSTAVADLLLEAGADPGARDGQGRTVLMRLVGTAPSEVFKSLIRAGADVAARANDGSTAVDFVNKKLDWWRQFAPDRQLEHQEDLREILALLLPNQT